MIVRLLFNNFYSVNYIYNRIQAPLYYSADNTDTNDKTETIDDKLDFLNQDDDDKEVIDLKDEKSDKTDDDKENKDDDKEDKDLKELEDSINDDEVDDEKLELATPVRRSEILKEFPELFKKFPYLEKAYYREQQYTEVFPTVDEAKEAQSKAEVLDKFENDLFEGKTEQILKSVKDNDPEAFNKIADNYLTTLANVDKTAYHHVISNITKHTIQAMLDESGGMDEEAGRNLKVAAQILNQFVFGSNKFTPPSKLSVDKPKNEEDDKLANEKKEFAQQKFDDAVDTLNTRVNNSIKSTIEVNLDPKKSMTDFVRKHATNEALEEISNLLSKDTRFKSLVDKLWEKAAKNNYRKELVEDIRNAYMSRAKTVLPTVIKTARNNALKGMGKRVSEDKEDDKKGPVTRRSTTSSNNDSGKSDDPKKVPRGMSNLDFMMQD